MTRPTQKSLDEAARAAGATGWAGPLENEALSSSIHAHALTLDQLHGRVEMSEAEELYRAVMGAYFGYTTRYSGILNKRDKSAIALIEAAIHKRDNNGWTEWNGGECPVPNDTPVEVKFRAGNSVQDSKPQTWNWDHYSTTADIIAYRVL